MPYHGDERSLFMAIDEAVVGLFEGERSGHDKYHLKRVRNLALKIQESEGGDRIVIGVAASLHDVHRGLQKLQDGKYCTPEESIPTVKRILDRVGGIPVFYWDKIVHCIRYHEEYGFNGESRIADDIETLIIQDADNLDAMGAIGIARTFMYSGAHGLAMYLPEHPLVGREGYDESSNDVSDIHHFYSKLLKLHDNMNTVTAIKMAEQLDWRMREFLRWFMEEWNFADPYAKAGIDQDD